MENINSRHTISLYMANKPGVLNRIALIFSRRGFNIDSLVVSESQDPKFSQMNIVATGDAESLEKIIGQLNKLVDVLHARDYSGQDVIQKEMAMIKINCLPEKRAEAMQIIETFKAQIIDLTVETLTVESQGTSNKLDALKIMLEPFGIREIVRSGKMLIARGTKTT
jgi:acetolactate synthase-1/3 small subunit